MSKKAFSGRLRLHSARYGHFCFFPLKPPLWTKVTGTNLLQLRWEKTKSWISRAVKPQLTWKYPYLIQHFELYLMVILDLGLLQKIFSISSECHHLIQLNPLNQMRVLPGQIELHSARYSIFCFYASNEPFWAKVTGTNLLQLVCLNQIRHRSRRLRLHRARYWPSEVSLYWSLGLP